MIDGGLSSESFGIDWWGQEETHAA
jgi:hypothetical protein